jgi:hypothetical protein
MKRLLLLVLLMPILANAAPYCDGMWTDHARFQLTNPHDRGGCKTCDSCHLNGNLHAGGAGGGATCNSCHLGTRPAATPKPVGHIQTSLDCITCHALKSSFDGARMNHTGIVTGCSTCHKKEAGHPEVSTQTCESCHATTSWSCGG